MRVGLGVLSLLLMMSQPRAHDVYSGLHDALGHLCCGGQDCEAVDQFRINAESSVDFYSRRQQAWINVPLSEITWIALPGAPAHWCGHATDDYVGSFVVTFCAFLDPGGS